MDDTDLDAMYATVAVVTAQASAGQTQMTAVDLRILATNSVVAFRPSVRDGLDLIRLASAVEAYLLHGTVPAADTSIAVD
jgi:hypothetical protein